MQPIPVPQVLDPDRPLRKRDAQFTEDDRPEAELLSIALHQTCAYARELWHDLDAVRAYLLNSLPPDPREPGVHTASASPTGPDDDTGWQHWIDAYAAVTSVLAGPHGDSGFGLSEARHQAQLRRTAPALAVPAEPHGQPEHPEKPAPVPAAPTPLLSDSTVGERAVPEPRVDPRRESIRKIVTIALALLAVRGLRPRRNNIVSGA